LTSALPDNYLPPNREVGVTPRAVDAMARTLTTANIPFPFGKTWTADGVSRETPGKIALGNTGGCLTVEMGAALFAVARFRQVAPGQLLLLGGNPEVSPSGRFKLLPLWPQKASSPGAEIRYRNRGHLLAEAF
jgi:hypothetical protein